MNNGQTGNIRNWQDLRNQKKTKTKHNTVCVVQLYKQTNTNNVNKILHKTTNMIRKQNKI